MLASQQQVQVCICEKPQKQSLQLQMSASVAASVIAVIATNPLDVVKTKMQVSVSNQHRAIEVRINKIFDGSSPAHHLKPFQIVKAVVHEEGLWGLWRGTSAGIIHALPSISIYLTCYEQMKSWLDQDVQILPELTPPIAGGVSRFFAAVLTCPLEVVRTKLMANTGLQLKLSDVGFKDWQRSNSMLAVLRQLALENGFGSLWKGIVPMLWRDVPFSAIYWSLAESTRNFLTVRLRIFSGGGLS